MNNGHFVTAGGSSAAGTARVGEIPPGYILRPATSTVSIQPQDDMMINADRSYSNLPYNTQVIKNLLF